MEEEQFSYVIGIHERCPQANLVISLIQIDEN